MKSIRLVLSLALAGATLAAVPALQSTAAGQPASAKPTIVERMKSEASGAVRISTQRATGEIGMIRSTDDLLPGRKGASPADAAAKATAYLRTYAAAFGARAGELRQTRVDADRYGWTIRFEQRYQGVPVFGSRLLANVDKAGHLTSVNGFVAPDLHLGTAPRLSAREAAHRAVGTVRQMPPTTESGKNASTAGIKAVGTKLFIYRMGATKGEAGRSLLAYMVEVSNRQNVRDMVFLDARTGKLVNRYSMASEALDRHLIEANGSSNPATFVQVWKEGDPFPGALNQDQQNEVTGTGNAYWLFKDTFGRDSYDGLGHSMTTVNNDGRIRCPNANWNGSTTNYCNGVTSDDVVAHEWGHAYTDYTSNLVYQWQPGALNESYSDVWGETVDLINGEQDAGEGDITTKRPDGLCSSHTPPLPVVIINSPADIAKICQSSSASFGPALTAAGVTSNVVVGLDSGADGSTTNGCTALTNPTAVAGKIALIDRGACGFVLKTKNAQNAGAIGVIIGNTVEALQGMSGVDATITIPTVMIKLSDRNLIVNRLATSAVNATMKDNSGATKTDSYRWLIGEKSTAFGGAIRDMWMPTCLGDPGKVSDAEYYCATDDAGGVHSNSGVPNHAYALLVDGGLYNGVNVTGIGIDKAAHLWFHTQMHFLTPVSGFPEMADGLQASCAALTGQPINKVSTAPGTPSGAATPITAGDCAQLANVIAATQLRAEPTQCNFQPMLNPNTPSVCGPGTKQSVVWKDDFEAGLGNWTPSEVVVYTGGNGYPWRASTSAPNNHPGGVAYGPDPDDGNCSGAAGDISSRDSITGPLIGMSGSVLAAPRLTFDHSMASEAGYDGGNVKISVNGAPFTVIPQSAYVFNAPGTTLISAATNTNPMASEQAWSGTDGGKVNSRWGQTQVDLAAAGVAAGDTIQLRFDMGRDGCGGLDGWYVDNVTVSTCKQATKMSAAHRPDPSVFGTGSTVLVSVQRDGTTGDTPTGPVSLSDSAGNLVSTGQLADGAATLAVPADFPVGTHTLIARYAGSDTLAPAAVLVYVNIMGAKQTKWLTTTVIRKPVNLPSYRENFNIRAKVTATGLVPTGKVVIKKDGKVIGTGTLKDGKVTITITKNLKVGTHKLLAKYLGSSMAQPSKHAFRIRILRN